MSKILSKGSYKVKSITASNTIYFNSVIDTKEIVDDKWVIIVTNLSRAIVFNKFEDKVDVILVHFSVTEKPILYIYFGKI